MEDTKGHCFLRRTWKRLAGLVDGARPSATPTSVTFRTGSGRCSTDVTDFGLGWMFKEEDLRQAFIVPGPGAYEYLCTGRIFTRFVWLPQEA